ACWPEPVDQACGGAGVRHRRTGVRRPGLAGRRGPRHAGVRSPRCVLRSQRQRRPARRSRTPPSALRARCTRRDGAGPGGRAHPGSHAQSPGRPGILGVNAGASFAVTIGVAFFGITSITGYIWLAFLGALIATVSVYIIGSSGRSRTVDPIRLTLAGAAVAAVLTGLTKGILLTNERAFDAFRSWDVGAIAGRDFDTITAILPFIIIGTVLALALSHSLNAVALGDDLAASLGTSVNRTRVFSILAVTLL